MSHNLILRVKLNGRLDQERLNSIRSALNLRRQGRLTDWEDYDFGYRYVRNDGARWTTLTLGRLSDTDWEVTISSDPELVIPDDEIRMIVAEVEAAAVSVGVTFVSETVYVDPPPPSYDDMQESENWLRSMHWDLPAQNLADLWPILGLHPTAPAIERREALLQFMKIPTWRPAPDRIKVEAAAFIEATRGLDDGDPGRLDRRGGPPDPSTT